MLAGSPVWLQYDRGPITITIVPCLALPCLTVPCLCVRLELARRAIGMCGFFFPFLPSVSAHIFYFLHSHCTPSPTLFFLSFLPFTLVVLDILVVFCLFLSFFLFSSSPRGFHPYLPSLCSLCPGLVLPFNSLLCVQESVYVIFNCFHPIDDCNIASSVSHDIIHPLSPQHTLIDPNTVDTRRSPHITLTHIINSP